MKKIIVANWKMNPKTISEASALAKAIEKGTRKFRKAEVVIAPPFPFLSLLRSIAPKLGAQDVFWESQGPYTGEVSASQLRSLGVRYVIIGHSERRAMGETNEMARKKLSLALKEGFWAMLCVGEHERMREVAFPEIIRQELREGLRGIPKARLRNLAVVYEPVWAISSQQSAEADTPQNVFEMSVLIRRELFRMAGKRLASRIPILYGGSVDDRNAASFLKEGRVDGLLVGGASLDTKKFIGIVQCTATL